MKVVENSTQNARNRTIFKNFLGGKPQTPLAVAHSFAARGMYTQNQKKFKLDLPPEKSCIRPCLNCTIIHYKLISM